MQHRLVYVIINSVEDDVLNEFEIMWEVRTDFPFLFFFESDCVQNLIRFPMRINNLSDQEMQTVTVYPLPLPHITSESFQEYPIIPFGSQYCGLQGHTLLPPVTITQR